MGLPTQWPSPTHSTSAFQRSLDLLDERLGSCDGLLATFTHCMNAGSADQCRQAGVAFQQCNQAKANRHSEMGRRCAPANGAFLACMREYNREPERCLAQLEALHACCEAQGVFELRTGL